MTEERGLLREAAPITVWNLVSRVTGLARVLVVGGAVGTTFLGNTYQSANLVSNLLFELVAAGLLSSVLVPTFVSRLRVEGRAGVGDLAGVVLGMLLAVLGPLVLAGMVLAEPLMRLLTVTVHDPAVRDEEVRLGSMMLVLFLPQVLLYAVGAVTTGVLHADRRFVASAAAPVANNLTVIIAAGLFWAMRDNALSLDLSGVELAVLGGGTTLGVLAMSAVPLLAARRAGIDVTPTWDPANRAVRAMARRGLWAGGYLALTQVLIAVTVVLANGAEGGVVAFHIAFTCFLLPFALLANPITTALYPRLAADAHDGNDARFAHDLTRGLRTLAALLLPASALLAAVALPAVRVLATGALSGGVTLVAAALAAYSFGLLGYGAFHLLTRAAYAEGDARTPTLVNLGVAIVGSVVMIAGVSGADSPEARVAMLGIGHSVATVGGALVLGFIVIRRRAMTLDLRPSFERAVVVAAVAGTAAWGVVHVLDRPGRLQGVLTVAAAGAVGVGVTVLAGGKALREDLRRSRET